LKPIANTLALSLMLVAGLALAKEGVKDPGVKLRMDTMDNMAQNLKLLANMAAGKMDFNAGDADTAKAAVLAGTKTIPDAFKGHEMDPASDALPVIWTQWDDFTKKADATRMAVSLIDTDTQDQLKTSLGQVAQACKTCHTTYRN
jgi:cytochrome c556